MNRKMVVSKIMLGVGALAFAGALIAEEAAQAQTEKPLQKPSAFGPRIQPAKRAARRGPPPEVIATYDDWKIQCETVRVGPGQKPAQAAPAEGEATTGKSDSAEAAAAPAQPQTRRLCGMVQSARDEKRPQLGVTLYISRVKQGDKTMTQMRIMAPIGVWLPQGIGLDIDGQAVGSMPYSNCLPQVCLARAETSPETLDRLKKGSVANFFIYAGPGAGVPLKISLKGFGKALEALDQL